MSAGAAQMMAAIASSSVSFSIAPSELGFDLVGQAPNFWIPAFTNPPSHKGHNLPHDLGAGLVAALASTDTVDTVDG